jgi:hypothetical protein
MDTDARSGQRMAEFARGVEVLRDRPRHVQGADFVPPPPSWAAAVDVAASLMEPHWDRVWSKPTDSDALTALAIVIYAVGGGEHDGDAVRELLTGLHIHGPNRQLAEPRLVDAVSTALTAAGHDLTDAQDPVAAAWKHLTRDRTKEWMSAPEFLRETSFPEVFGDPGPESLLLGALPTMARAVAPA